MKTVAASSQHVMQRVKVGMVGLAAVILLIGLVSAVFSAANREQPVAVAGASKPDTVANLTISNDALPAEPASEPLAEIGVAPSTGDTNAAQAARPGAKQ